MQASLAQRALQTIRRHGMLTAGARLGVGVSGGSDSVALLRLLGEVAPGLGVCLGVAHFNHQLRGAESDDDERFVAELADELDLPFFAGRGDVAEFAREHRLNLEDAARRSRYAFFSSLIESGKFERLAVAHTVDDQAETVLARLARGTGPAGLAAIYPLRGYVVRPLIEVRRGELREYLLGIGQSWREDSSNADTTRMRARLRHNVLPVLERELQHGIVTNLGRLASMAREDEAFWQALVEDRLRQLVRREGNRAGIRCADLLAPLPWNGVALPVEAGLAVTRRLVRGIIQEVCETCRELTSVHVEQVLRLAANGGSGRQAELPGVRAERSFEWLWFSVAPTRTAEADPMRRLRKRENVEVFSHAIELGVAGESSLVVVPEIERRFRLKVIDWSGRERDTNTSIGQGALDRDLLGSPLVLRNWRSGDSFRPLGRRSSHKLKDFLQAGRVPFCDRAGWPVLTSREAVVWTRGLPPAMDFAPGKTTQTAVVIGEEEV